MAPTDLILTRFAPFGIDGSLISCLNGAAPGIGASLPPGPILVVSTRLPIHLLGETAQTYTNNWMFKLFRRLSFDNDIIGRQSNRLHRKYTC